MGTEAQDIREMKRLLEYANYRKVGDAVGVKRATVSSWARGIDVSPARVIQVREVMLRSVGRRKRTAAPDVPERLDEIEDLIRSIAKVSGIDLDRVEAMRRELRAARPQRPRGGALQRKVTNPRDE